MIDWIVGIGTLYLLWQQNQIFRKQNEIFARQETVPVSFSDRAASIKRYWPMLAMGAMTIVTGYDIYARHSLLAFETGDYGSHQTISPMNERQEQILRHIQNMEFDWGNYKYQEVIGRAFKQETVLLDGNRFDNCTFRDVYDGTGPFQLNGYAFTGTTNIQTESNVVAQIMNVYVYLKMAPGGIVMMPRPPKK